MDPVILTSTRKHGSDLTMLIGAAQDGTMLEVGVAEAEGIEFIVHAMPAREKFLR